MRISSIVCAVLYASASAVAAQVVVVEPGHVATKLVDSAAPLHPSQALLETTLPLGSIESIGVDAGTGELYIQLISPGQSFTSATTHIFKVSAGGVVTPVALNTLFGANGRGTDLAFDALHGLLVTEDQNTTPARVASVDPVTGTLGTYSPVAPGLLVGATFGMDFSKGTLGSDVPFGQIVFATDVGGGINSVSFGGATSALHLAGGAMPDVGDDLVIQPDGDWVWIGDFYGGIIAYSPAPPHGGVSGGLTLQTIFEDAGLKFVHGSRGSACPGSGAVYVSYSGWQGGSAIFRIDPALTTATLVATVGDQIHSGLQDLTVGPGSAGGGESLYFTVHDSQSGGQMGGEEVWELTLPECVLPECFLLFGPGSGHASWGDGGHVWTTQLSDVTEFHAVTLDDNPSFPIDLPVGLGPRTCVSTLPGASGESRVAWRRFSVQVLMWNPDVFPNNPEQYSNRLEVTIWPNGSVSAVPFGPQDGIGIELQILTSADGDRRIRFPFKIHDL